MATLGKLLGGSEWDGEFYLLGLQYMCVADFEVNWGREHIRLAYELMSWSAVFEMNCMH